MKKYLVLITLFLSTNALSYPVIPETDKTPGKLCTTSNEDFEEFRYEEQIPYCFRNVTKSKKTAVYESYSIPAKCRHRYTVDHFIPLSIGGDNSFKNLWPEHKLVKALRPNLEIDIYHQLARGEITQKEAVLTIKTEKLKLAKLVARVLGERASSCDDVDSFLVNN